MQTPTSVRWALGLAAPLSRARTGKPRKSRRLAAASILAMVSLLRVQALARRVPDNGPRDPASATASTRAAPSVDVKLTLRVYNYAGIDRVSLAGSEKVAAAILEDPGIETVWIECELSQTQLYKYPACQSDMGTTDLVLRILPLRMGAKLPASGEPLGFAQQCPETESACELTVLSFRVDELATHGYRADLVLGHVIAHEVAHVLLRPGHSEEGIMRREWSRSDLRRISWGMQLRFTSDQSRQLRHAVLRRMTLAITESSARADLVAR